MKKRVRDVALIALISLALFIPLAEIVLRFTCTYCTWTEQNGDGFVSPYAVRESSWYHVREPNTVIRMELPEFDYEIRTNSQGLRDIEHPVSKRENEVRLLAIGDSFTESWGARFEKTWLNELGRSLNAQQEKGFIRVICAGVSGSDPFYGYRLLADKLMVYQPDYVVLVVNHSDIMDVITRGGMERFQADGTVRGANAPPMPWGYRWSQLARLVLFEAFDYTHALVRRSERDRQSAQAVGKLQALMLEFQALLESRGIEFFLVLQPYYNELQRDEYQKLAPLIEFARRNQINVIDTKPYLHQKLIAHDNRLADLYWPGDMHFTELGYRYFAEAIEIGLRPTLTEIGTER